MSERYAELREAIPDATPGPWETERYEDGWLVNGDGWIIADYSVPDPDYDHAADARYIAAANPSVVAALLRERDALHAALSRLVAKWDAGSLDAVGDPEVWDEKTGLIARARALLGEETA